MKTTGNWDYAFVKLSARMATGAHDQYTFFELEPVACNASQKSLSSPVHNRDEAFSKDSVFMAVFVRFKVDERRKCYNAFSIENALGGMRPQIF